MSIAVSMVSDVLEASPFQMTAEGESSRTFASTAARAGLRLWVSFMTQNDPVLPSPSVVKEWTLASVSGPRFFILYPPLKLILSAPTR